jgi:hypothetical protein
MDSDSNREQPDAAASDMGVMLFDGWDFTPVRFPPIQSSKGAAATEPDPSAHVPAR